MKPLSPKPYRNRDVLSLIRANKLYSVYIVKAMAFDIVKIGIADDPVHRFGAIQAGNWNPLALEMYAWTSGHPVAKRIAQGVMAANERDRLRGDWFALPFSLALESVRSVAESLNAPLWLDDDLARLLSAPGSPLKNPVYKIATAE